VRISIIGSDRASDRAKSVMAPVHGLELLRPHLQFVSPSRPLARMFQMGSPCNGFAQTTSQSYYLDVSCPEPIYQTCCFLWGWRFQSSHSLKAIFEPLQNVGNASYDMNLVDPAPYPYGKVVPTALALGTSRKLIWVIDLRTSRSLARHD
jgi:hypothetical protein